VKADLQQIKAHLKVFAFKTLFYEELGWDRLRESHLKLAYSEHLYTFIPLAEKEGFKVYLCTPENECIPNDQILKQVDKLIEPYAWEHLTIYVDIHQEQQVWLWVHRKPGQPALPRINKYHINESGELLAQKLAILAIWPEEEEWIDHVAVIGLIKKAFDIEKVTKTFYERFTEERMSFLNTIQGITDQDDLEWYTTVMLSRLMFVYFIQRKGLLDIRSPDRLDGDPYYLRNRLKITQSLNGSGTFYSFYQDFLLHLFHDGLNKRQRTPQLEQIIGTVPYLNGGLFDIHDLEYKYSDISIPDETFEHLFDFFEQFDWHIDDRTVHDNREINPDILGYIFEKHVNNKSQGAYYTKEDITNYISKNTIIPFLFSRAMENHSSHFTVDSPIWLLIRNNPDDYIYDAIAWGVNEPLPSEIEAGIDDTLFRTCWNKSAPEEYTMLAETWREVIARRQHYHECRTQMVLGKIISIDDLITYNLNICTFAADVIKTCEIPELLLSFYTTLEKITILDPTCGSGAFLFAALNILKPLYQACLQRMRTMITWLDASSPTQISSQATNMKLFRAILKQVDYHHSQEFFILKSIIVNNLYGVDILKEAVEICKLRLFLKLVAQIEKPQDIEPLPDIDFNVLAGNTLVGFDNIYQVRQIVTKSLFGKETQGEALIRIEEQTRAIECLEQDFRTIQKKREEHPDHLVSEHKQTLRARQSMLRTELNSYFASEYGINYLNTDKQEEYQRKYVLWLKNYQPFHWMIEFGGIVRRGGFDVIIGNPPYVEYNAKKFPYTVRDLQTLPCSNIYPFVVERSRRLLSSNGRQGMILPLSAFSTKNMTPLIQRFSQWFPQSWLSFYHFRPSMLFSGGKAASIPTSIYLARADGGQTRFSTSINKWPSSHREQLFPCITYCKLDVPNDPHNQHYYPKLMQQNENAIMKKILQHRCVSGYLATTPNKNTMSYRSAGGLYWKVFVNFSWPFKSTSNKQCSFQDRYDRDIFVALFNSSLFWWYYTVTFDTFNLKDYMLFGFHFPYPENAVYVHELKSLCQRLMDDYRKHAKSLKRGATDSYTLYAYESKKIIDEIDVVLAQIYGLSNEELDFIINYDIKYRMGSDNRDN
jgi:Eco57I restriction-modification methylase